MKIYEAFDDVKLRRGYKLWLQGLGLSIIRVDKLATRFGSYISRIRSVGYERKLLACETEDALRREFDEIFKVKWKNHLGYPEVPEHFYYYLDYLHTAMAKQPTLAIEGLAPDDDAVPAADAPTCYEERFIADGKLRVLANPVLIRQIRALFKEDPEALDDAVALCRDFYACLDLDMTDREWLDLLDLLTVKGAKSDKTLVRSIEITFPDGTVKVLNGSDAVQEVADLIGIDRLKTCIVKHMSRTMITRTVPPKFGNYFRELPNGLFLNVMGTNVDKFKTLNILNSHYRLRLVIRLTNEKPTPKRKAAAPTGAKRGRKPKVRVEEPPMKRVEPIFNEGDIVEDDANLVVDGLLNF